MSQQIGGYPPSTSSDAPPSRVARDEAGEVGRTAADAGRQVAGTAAEQAGNVAEEVRAQSRDLFGEVRGQVQDQARTGQQKASEGVRAVAQELREMVDGGGTSGPASELARQAADRGDRLAEWLPDRAPGDLVDEVRAFARRRPWAFLAGAALAGVVAGRLTRGAVDSAREDAAPGPAPRHAYREPVRPLPAPTSPQLADPGLPPAYPATETPTPPQGLPVTPAAPPVATPRPPATEDPLGGYTPGRAPLDDPFGPGNGGSR
jgi:ElaB/YqjD/DUF883 family membrane-anchored ribosome-binding protein